MATESFTTSDQIARDMAMGVFPKQSDRTKHELAERERIFGVALESLKQGFKSTTPAPALNIIWRSIAHDIAMKLAPTAPAPAPEHNGGDVW